MGTSAKKKLHNLYKIQGGLCCYCEVKMRKGQVPPEKDTATLEHLQRKANGGTNGLDNLAASCFECNSGRGLIDWLTYKTYRMGEMVCLP